MENRRPFFPVGQKMNAAGPASAMDKNTEFLYKPDFVPGRPGDGHSSCPGLAAGL